MRCLRCEVVMWSSEGMIIRGGNEYLMPGTGRGWGWLYEERGTQERLCLIMTVFYVYSMCICI
jgi:hypothetical protein